MLPRLSRLFSKGTAANGNEPPSEVMEFAGFVLAHCAAIADANRSGELICPFAVLSDGSGRRVVDFESDTQEEAVQKGWESLPEAQCNGHWWAFGREGIYRGDDEAMDVLTVTFWAPAMTRPYSLVQRFARGSSEELVLVRPPELLNHDQEAAQVVAEWSIAPLQRGIGSHPSGSKIWRGNG